METIAYYARCEVETQVLTELLAKARFDMTRARTSDDLSDIANRLRFMARALDEQARSQQQALIQFAAGQDLRVAA